MARTKAASIKPSFSDRVFDIVNYTFMTLVMIVTLYPFLNVLAISLNDSVDTVRGGITIWPRQFTLENYMQIFQYEGLITGAKISVLRTLAGTLLGLISGSMLGYVLSRIEFQGRKFMSTFLALTMYFSGGMIPVFILIRDLNMMNSFLVYIIPGMVSAFNVFVIRSFIDGLPYSLQESAKLDGANDFTIYYRIILPLCKPVLATIALFLAVGQWNSWFDTYLYNGSAPHLTTLQFELMKVLQSTQGQNTGMGAGQNMAEIVKQVSPESIKMAITIVVTVPILLVYPFLQRYFVKGMTLGAVKS
ncbi:MULTISPECIES: carbohydrate ABC transporter permease [Paenibacillus]|uniref:ABC transporter permease subunit n=1 Tax=Paenibacillus campinasensis TaxID=66347 RepID=A0A268EMP7_9BACL|nr:carbohydrate ABC transporter permease [Paenibacillus campinasensis]MUG67019.1 ABC transporter permease subunit [Paenibacillus campinasensis]PAD74392.1 sugar ABC transporter permease [Paenibacillus campinasensis]